MVSATLDAAANAAFQAAPSWLTRANTPPANDLFRDLVSQNAPQDPTNALPLPPPPSNNAEAPPPPPPAHHGAANNNAAAANNNANNNNEPNPAPANDASNNGANANQPSDASNTNSGTAATASGASQSSSTATSDSTQPADPKSKDSQTGADSTVVDAAILAQQVGSATPTPVAVAISASTPVTNAPTSAPISGGPTAPLAIAAAAIAASSQPLSPPSGPTVPGNADAGTTPPATSAPAATKAATGSATITTGFQTASTTPTDAAALTATVEATVPIAPKTTQGKTQAAATNGSAANTTSAGTTTAGTAVDATQNAATPQIPTTGKQETANVAVQGTPTDATAQATTAPARDHAAATGITHAATADLADTNNTQAVGALQPQFTPTSALTSTSNLTVTAAAGGAVPLNGVALEIAANVKSGKTSFEIRLDPADLGRIDVRVQIDQNGQVTSHLTVEKPETLSMLRQDAPQLQQALSDAGLKTDSGGLQFSLRDQSSGQNSGNGGNPNAQRLIISDEDAVPAAVAGRSYGRSLGSNTGVDIRV